VFVFLYQCIEEWLRRGCGGSRGEAEELEAEEFKDYSAWSLKTSYYEVSGQSAMKK
jgi:hypothetical protein